MQVFRIWSAFYSLRAPPLQHGAALAGSTCGQYVFMPVSGLAVDIGGRTAVQPTRERRAHAPAVSRCATLEETFRLYLPVDLGHAPPRGLSSRVSWIKTVSHWTHSPELSTVYVLYLSLSFLKLKENRRLISSLTRT